MEPELKALVDAAIQGGASRAEVRKIINDYYGQKKKEKTSVSDSPLVQEVSTESTSNIGVSSTEASGDSATVPSIDIVDPYSQESIDRYNERNQGEILTSYLYDGKEITWQCFTSTATTLNTMTQFQTATTGWSKGFLRYGTGLMLENRNRFAHPQPP